MASHHDYHSHKSQVSTTRSGKKLSIHLLASLDFLLCDLATAREFRSMIAEVFTPVAPASGNKKSMLQ